MYNLYYKLDDIEKQNVYRRTMQYMITVNSEGKEIVEFYNPEKFILVEDYLKLNQDMKQSHIMNAEKDGTVKVHVKK